VTKNLLGLWCMVWKSDEVEIVAKSRIGRDVQRVLPCVRILSVSHTTDKWKNEEERGGLEGLHSAKNQQSASFESR